MTSARPDIFSDAGWTRRGSIGCSALTEWRPTNPGGPIEAIWYFDGAVSRFRELHLPNGRVDLVVQLDDVFRLVNGRVQARCPMASMAGLQLGATLIEAFRREPSRPHRTRIIGIRFHPAAAFAIIGGPLHHTTRRVVDFVDLLGRAAEELIDSCCETRDTESCVKNALHWVSARIARSRSVDRRVLWSATQIELSTGKVPIGRLQEQTALSKRRLADAFREQIGVTPKLYARIVRLRRALTLLHVGGRSPAEVAGVVGYYDQSHMNRDFRKLAGLGPGDFLAGKRRSPTCLILAR